MVAQTLVKKEVSLGKLHRKCRVSAMDCAQGQVKSRDHLLLQVIDDFDVNLEAHQIFNEQVICRMSLMSDLHSISD